MTTAGLTLVLTPALVPVAVHAASSVNNNVTGGLCSGVNGSTNSGGTVSLNPGTDTSGSDCTSDPAAGDSLGTILSTVIKVFSIIVGVVSVIMIIVGGFKYITSGGNDSNVAGAKNTIMYALIGLVVVALAQIIVHYVLSRLGTTA